jgi:hypothetical protein
MSVQRCPRCKGEGSVTVTYDDYGMADPKDVMCPVCGGNRFVSPATREAQRSGSVPTSTDGEHQALIEVRQQLQQVEQERDKLQSATEGLATLGVRLNAKKERVEAELIAIKAVAGTLIDALKAFVAADEERAQRRRRHRRDGWGL